MTKEKEIQKELKNIYSVELKKVYNNDSKMITWCVNRAKYIFKLRDMVVPFETMHIEKDFWFGYSDLGQGLSYEENNERVNKHEENVVAYFINRNLSDIINKIDKINEILETYENEHYFEKGFVILPEYGDRTNIGEIFYYNYYGHRRDDIKEEDYLTVDELKEYLQHLMVWKSICEKQLQTYLKKYGTKHISFNTYWVDR